MGLKTDEFDLMCPREGPDLPQRVEGAGRTGGVSTTLRFKPDSTLGKSHLRAVRPQPGTSQSPGRRIREKRVRRLKEGRKLIKKHFNYGMKNLFIKTSTIKIKKT